MSEQILKLSEETGIPVTATGDVHYIRKEDKAAYRCLKAIKAGEKLTDAPAEVLPDLDLKPIEEMQNIYREHPEALQASVEIAEQCRVDVSLGQTRLPSFPTPDGTSADDYLTDICMEGLRSRFGTPDERYLRRLQYELDVIKRMKFSDYFLIV